MTMNSLKITGIALVCLFLVILPVSAVATVPVTGPHPIGIVPENPGNPDLKSSDIAPLKETLTQVDPSSQSAPYAYGNVVYVYIFVDFTERAPPDSDWNSYDMETAKNYIHIAAEDISGSAPTENGFYMSNGYAYTPTAAKVIGKNTGNPHSSDTDGWMETALINLGFTDGSYTLTPDGRVSDDVVEYVKTLPEFPNTNSVILIFCTHDIGGGYAVSPLSGYADRAHVYFFRDTNLLLTPPTVYEHEIVHLYGAMDEDLGSSYCNGPSIHAVSPMKELYANTNHESCTPHTTYSVMMRGYEYSTISDSSRKFIGWGDFDDDGKLDLKIMDDDPHDNDGSRIGVFRSDSRGWFLDRNGNGKWSYADDNAYGFGMVGDTPVTGDWNGDGNTEIGVVRNGGDGKKIWILDNGDGKWSAADDALFTFGVNEDTPVTGDWDGDINHKTEIGVFRNGNQFRLDSDGDRILDDTDASYAYGDSGVIPVTGDWNNNGKTEIGVFWSSGRTWLLDDNANGRPDDTYFGFGMVGDKPVTGDWNNDGYTEVGVFRSNCRGWFLDSVRNRKWDEGLDSAYGFGLVGDTPVTGKWKQPYFS